MLLRATPQDVVWLEDGRATLRDGMSLEVVVDEPMPCPCCGTDMLVRDVRFVCSDCGWRPRMDP